MEFCNKTHIFKNGAFQNLNVVTINIDRIMKLFPHEHRFQNQITKCPNCNCFIIGNNCEICDKVAASAFRTTSIIDYSIPSPLVNNNKTVNVVFCIDISGSMGGDRLENVKKACSETIDNIVKMEPSCRVSFVTFESSTKYYGDGTVVEYVSNLPPYGFLVKKNKNLLPISQSWHTLKTAIYNLQATGGTTMCGALAESIAIGDVVILCTDGATSDKNESNYDQLIKFAKDNCVKINIIGFDGTESDLASIQKFAFETNGIVKKTSDAIDLSNIFQSAVANISSILQSVKFDLITNNNEFRLNGLTEPSTHVVTNDLSKEYIYDIQLLKQDSTDCIIQLQIHNPDKIRVVTQKLILSEFDVKNSTHVQLNYELFNAKVSKTLANMLFRDKIEFSEIDKHIKAFNDLHTSLSRTPPEEFDKHVRAIDVASKKGYKSTTNMKDGEFYEIYNSINDTSKTINQKLTCQFLPTSSTSSTAIDHLYAPKACILLSDSELTNENEQSDTDETSSNIVFKKIVKEHNQLEGILTEILNKNWENVVISDDSSFTQCIDEACDNIEKEHSKRMIAVILILLKMIKRIYIRFSGRIQKFSENKVIPILSSKASILSSSASANTTSIFGHTIVSGRSREVLTSNQSAATCSVSSNNTTFIDEFDLLKQQLEQINVIIESIQSSGLVSDIELIKSKYYTLIKLVENYEDELNKSLITDINDITCITAKLALDYVYKIEVNQVSSTKILNQSNNEHEFESLSESSSIRVRKLRPKTTKQKKVSTGSK